MLTMLIRQISDKLVYSSMKQLIFVLLLGFAGSNAFGQTDGISAKEASIRIGDSVTVKDKVFGGRLLNNGMTLLNLGGEFPNH